MACICRECAFKLVAASLRCVLICLNSNKISSTVACSLFSSISRPLALRLFAVTLPCGASLQLFDAVVGDMIERRVDAVVAYVF